MIGSGIGVGVTRPAGLSRAIRSLFASGEKGVWFDPSDFSTLFQDIAGTTPVTAVGQPVRLMLDKSGNANYITFSGTNPPTLQQDASGAYYLQPVDATSRGVNSTLSITAPFTASVVANFSVNSTQLLFDSYSSSITGYIGQNSTLSLIGTATTSIQAPLPVGKDSVSVVFNGASSIYRADGIQISTGTLSASGLSGLSLFDIHGSPSPSISGYNSTRPFYGLVIRSGILNDSQITECENYLSNIGRLPAPPAASIFAIGDSTSAAYSGYQPVLSFVSTSKTKTTVAYPGDSCAMQLDRWNKTKFKNTSSVAVIECGLNDLDPAIATATTIASLQSLVNEVVMYTTGAVFVAQLTPCLLRLMNLYGATNGPIAYQKWLDINTAIAGNGATPITGVTGRITAHVAQLNDGSGNLLPLYNPLGDGIHPDDAGRQIMATAWTDAIAPYL